MKPYSRRSFIRTGSTAGLSAAALATGASNLLAISPYATPYELQYGMSGPLSLGDPLLRALALRALEAAQQAGADFADVRIQTNYGMQVGIRENKPTTPSLGFRVQIGIRAAVKSAWGYAESPDVSYDGVVGAAKLATTLAKSGYTLTPREFEFAPTPVVIGDATPMWETPIERDPFSVPIGEQEALWIDACEYARRSVPSLKSYRGNLNGGAAWQKSERLFASTEGALITQRIYYADTYAITSGSPRDDYTRYIGDHVKGLLKGGYGYEAVSRLNLRDSWREVTENIVSKVTSPEKRKSVDVGRYDIVFSPYAISRLLMATIAPALDTERTVGQISNKSGTTYAMPPMKILGHYKLGSPILNVHANRSRPNSGAAIGWDDEGVKPDDFTLIKEGIIIDYITTRSTAPSLSDWYKRAGASLKSHGCATGLNASLGTPNLSIQPGSEEITLQDLIKGVKKGFYVENMNGESMDHQLLNGQFKGSRAYEITNGKLGTMVKDMGIQFSTPKLWSSLIALGGPSSSVVDELELDVNSVGANPSVAVESVPAIIRDVNVVNTGKLA